MNHYFIPRLLIILPMALALVACEGNQGAAIGTTPDVSETQSGAVDCAAPGSHCALVPTDYVKPPVDTTPSISLPDESALIATTGSAFSFPVNTKNVSKLTVECPDLSANISPYQGIDGLYSFFISKMPDKDLHCSVVGKTSDGEIKVQFIIKAQKPSVLQKLTIKGLPSNFIKIVTGQTGTISPVEVVGFQANTPEPIFSCNKGKAKIVKDNDGKFSLSIQNDLAPEQIDLCTLLIQSLDGYYTKEYIAVVSVYPLPIIQPHFDPKTPLLLKLVPLGKPNQGLYTVEPSPEFSIKTVDGKPFKDSHEVSLKCDGVGFLDQQALIYLNNPDPLWKMNIHYKTPEIGDGNCRIAVALQYQQYDYPDIPVTLDFKVTLGQ